METVRLKERDQVASVFDKPWLDVIAAPLWVMAVEVSAENDIRGSLIVS